MCYYHIALHRTSRLYSKLIRQNLFLSKLNKGISINAPNTGCVGVLTAASCRCWLKVRNDDADDSDEP